MLGTTADKTCGALLAESSTSRGQEVCENLCEQTPPSAIRADCRQSVPAMSTEHKPAETSLAPKLTLLSTVNATTTQLEFFARPGEQNFFSQM